MHRLRSVGVISTQFFLEHIQFTPKHFHNTLSTVFLVFAVSENGCWNWQVSICVLWVLFAPKQISTPFLQSYWFLLFLKLVVKTGGGSVFACCGFWLRRRCGQEEPESWRRSCVGRNIHWNHLQSTHSGTCIAWRAPWHTFINIDKDVQFPKKKTGIKNLASSSKLWGPTNHNTRSHTKGVVALRAQPTNLWLVTMGILQARFIWSFFGFFTEMLATLKSRKIPNCTNTWGHKIATSYTKTLEPNHKWDLGKYMCPELFNGNTSGQKSIVGSGRHFKIAIWVIVISLNSSLKNRLVSRVFASIVAGQMASGLSTRSQLWFMPEERSQYFLANSQWVDNIHCESLPDRKSVV